MQEIILLIIQMTIKKKEDESNQDNILMKSIVSHKAEIEEN